ncbi:MAG TPA: ribosome biogenesis GTPase Der [Ktedonobacter sp.]|jgi:GTP-binding protein|nr:ribosome biogenesis GTPase Der [Ktedonobacter sp.]HAH01048.1 ribosome biogenesis GTPase Der [Ktedonobacter sp.]HAT47237.1 ribosome biogenesis GTPase Der [Ktedonobacter sp.]HBE25849.1 ribosome biogenesis GTPase Der [Ktedonobacter sp.]HCF85008.1 ribosome biogenesis GTPase Der [Ktedonobacter sp.]
MKPLVAIVGRPNVGKSTFFNRMIGERIAVVEDLPGTTRDRIYGNTDWNGREFTLIDTGGLEFGSNIPVGQVGLTGQPGDIMKHVQAQAELAIEEADVTVFMVDARSGITASDEEVAELLRHSKKPVILAANKADNTARRQDAVEFYSLGLGEPIVISSIQGTGTGDLLDVIVEALPPEDEEAEDEDNEDVSRIAIVGRPNVGKSSLLNAILGVERTIVSDIPGTTRDAIDTELQFKGKKLILIDTAGIRRRGKVGPGIEKFSVLRSTRAIERCDVALLLVDASEGLAAQDTHIAGEILEKAKGVVVVVNKWDLAQEQQRAERRGEYAHPKEEIESAEAYRRIIAEGLKFIPFAPIVFTSAKTGYHVPSLLETVQLITEMRYLRIPTARLNEVVQDAVRRHNPTVVRNKVMKIYYATQTQVNPPTFVFFVNDTQAVHFTYERYLENKLREAFSFKGTAIRMFFKPRSKVELK